MDMTALSSGAFQPAFMQVAGSRHQAASQNAPDGKDPKAWAAAQDFESQFLSSMFQSMFKGPKTDETFGGGQGEEMFRSLLVDQYGQEMTRSGGIGLADTVYSEIIKLQEQHQ